MLTELVRERLAHVLAENRPRRASPAEVRPAVTVAKDRPNARSAAVTERHSAVFGRAAAAEARSGGRKTPDSGPPDFEPSDDGEDGAADRRQRGPVVDVGPSSRADEPALSLLDDWEADPPPRRTFGRAHIGVICALLLVGLLSAGWAVLRARPVAIAGIPVSGAASSAPRSSSPVTTASSSAPAPVSIMVHVLGAVKKPGVVTLAERARVRDAIEAAGGLRRDAAPADLNLAQVLTDGQQVVIGTDETPSGEVRDGGQSGSSDGSGTASSSSSQDGPKLNLNSASQAQLEGLPGVGPVTAAKIVAWRQEHGRFTRVEELQEVDGIGPKTFAEIAPHARV